VETLIQLVRYNTWSNRCVFDLCGTVAPALLRETDQGSIGSIEMTLKHLVGVEESYLAMLRGEDLSRRFGPREAYEAQDLAWFRGRAAELGEGFLALLSERNEAWLDGPMQVPWFDFAMTTRDGLLQALTHSAQHRGQVLSVLGAQGVSVPDVDYVFMLREDGRAGSR
jgi:uncharacterized damage-inducible protein DinB